MTNELHVALVEAVREQLREQRVVHLVAVAMTLADDLLVSDGDMTTGLRAERFATIVDDGEQAHRQWAHDVKRRALLAGYGSIIKSHMKARCLTKVKRRKSPTTTVIGVPRSVDGRIQWHQVSMADATLEELRDHREMLRANASAIRSNLRNIDRVIALAEQAPGARTAGEAATRLGTSIEKVLAA